MSRRAVSSVILIVIFIFLAVITLPGFFKYFYQTGTGHAFLDIYASENLPWDSMTDTERAPYRARAHIEGLKCAILMTFGQHVPGYLFIFITIGLLTPSIPHGFRVFLRIAFFAVWILGMFFLSFGVCYWGPAYQFPKSLGPAFVIYLVAAMAFGIVIGIVKLFQRGMRRRHEPPRLSTTK